jgi:hypothetical protein
MEMQDIKTGETVQTASGTQWLVMYCVTVAQGYRVNGAACRQVVDGKTRGPVRRLAAESLAKVAA